MMNVSTLEYSLLSYPRRPKDDSAFKVHEAWYHHLITFTLKTFQTKTKAVVGGMLGMLFF